MLFFEYSFLFVFLPVVLAVYYGLPGGARNTWLLIASLAFYASSSLLFLPLLLLSIGVDFVAGGRVARAATPRARRGWLLFSLVVNLGALAAFKYVGLVTGTLGAWLGSERVPLIEAALPIGISFYTFQSLSYTIDCYRGQIEPARRLRDFAAYVAMFPQLVAGPIVRFRTLRDQLVARAHTVERFASGVWLLILGIAKKLLVADTLAAQAKPLFAATSPGFLDAWCAMLLFAGQIYFDFWAYTDMARGLGRMFGFELPENFRAPYRARSFADFWHRWHITLSTWLRDYLYIALGGNRRGATRTGVNLMITMALGGLWHGASWNFLLWGVLHGLLLAGERALRGRVPAPPAALRSVLVFTAVTLAWVPFRFEHFAETVTWLAAMSFLGNGVGAVSAAQAAGVAVFLALVWLPRPDAAWTARFDWRQTAAACALLLLSLWVGYGRVELSPFLYFRF